jgi:dTDP-4-dehydrorhamnose reductase
MNILIFGGNGMLGHKLLQIFDEKFDVWMTLREDFKKIENIFPHREKVIENIEIESVENIRAAIIRASPDVVVNAIGVIKQLPTSKDVIKTLTINSIFPHRLAELALEFNFRLITVSTDCVFTGDKGNYTEDDVADALDLYGKSKLFGEATGKNCLTLRTSIIGRELNTSHSLVEWFLSNRNGKVRGFENAIYSGFPTIVFAEIIADIIENHPEMEGLYHVSSDPINKYELLKLINEKYGANIEIEPYKDFYIDRSLNSDKFRAETGFGPMSWEKMIEIMAQDTTPYEKIRK